MNIDELFASLSENQKKLIQALLDNPEGLESKELAAKTHVSNKSATITPEVRQLLEEHGLELTIEREGRASLWLLKRLKRSIALTPDEVDFIEKSLDNILEEIQILRRMIR